MTDARPVRLHDFTLSGHAHRARLMLSLLAVPHELVPVDLASGAQRSPAFLALNPLGQVPVLEDGDVVVADSNAILVWLARTRDVERRWLPEDALAQARIQRWFGLSAGPLASGPAAARAARVFGRPMPPQAQDIATRLFGVMEAHLAGREWLADDHATVADVSMYSYTAHAPEGGIPLSPWPRLREWLARVESLPGFVGMPRSPVPDAA